MYQKTLGYLLLTFGIFTILFSTVSLYEVYSGRKNAPTLIDQSGIAISLSALTGQDAGRLDLLSSKTLNTSFNLFMYFICMSFIASSGFKIATLGVNLLRPINIHSSVI